MRWPIPEPLAGQVRVDIALIVPLLNEAANLPRLAGMARSCHAASWIWVDGGSTDGTPERLSEAGFACHSAPAGRAAQMNAGAGMTGANILLFLHADTVIDASHLEAVQRSMRDPGVVGGRFDVRLSGTHPAFRLIESFINLRSRCTRISTGDQAIFVRREVFEAMGGFAEIALMEDVEFSRRLRRRGRVACLSERAITSSRRWERHGIVRTVLLMWKLRLLYFLGVSPRKLASMYRESR